MKIWLDDIRPAPEGYEWCKSVIEFLLFYSHRLDEIEFMDFDHDAGDYVVEGGDYIEILKWLDGWYNNYLSYHKRVEDHHSILLAETISKIKFRFHSANPVGVENMRRIIERNGWEEVK